MGDFRKLLQLLKRELAEQEKMLAVLGRERVAIVAVKQDQIEALAEEKNRTIEAARMIEQQRTAAMRELLPPQPARKPLKISEIIAACGELDIKRNLENAVSELKKTALAVKDMNDHNAVLIKQSLGLIASSLSIIRSAPETDLPTYGASGRLRDEEEPAFARPTARITTEV